MSKLPIQEQKDRELPQDAVIQELKDELTIVKQTIKDIQRASEQKSQVIRQILLDIKEMRYRPAEHNSHRITEIEQKLSKISDTIWRMERK